MANFVERVVLHLRAGNGGHGVASVHREKFKPLGGPDGGNGGDGGDIVLRVDPQMTTLIDYHHSPHRSAPNGRPGEGDERNGAQGADLVRGTADSLRGSGHSRVVVDLRDVRTADDAGLDILHQLRRDFAADGGELVVRA